MPKLTKQFAEEIAFRLLEEHPVGSEINIDDLKNAITDGAGLDGRRKEVFVKYLEFFKHNKLIELHGFGHMFVTEDCEWFIKPYLRRIAQAEPQEVSVTLESFDVQYLEVLR